MSFSPFNPTVKRCLQGMQLEEQQKTEDALAIYMQAWTEASSDFEKFLAAHYVARAQKQVTQKLHWLFTQLELGLQTNDTTVYSALSGIFEQVALCYESLALMDKAAEARAEALHYQVHPIDKGPFYHGTKAALQVGDVLVPGGTSNYKSDLKMTHIYFTGLVDGAGLAAALAKGDGTEYVYQVEPEGEFENDPNLTNKKFPGNPSRSYRSMAPLKIIAVVKDWNRPPEEELKKFREKIEQSNGEIIN